ncbi:FAD-dependent monooxygenase [Actinoplanes sp. NEAU-A12]|uniref:FAD-dependent monooxygenase n=1 Tax=Actinoplanes sandaracinus TaxID=3045177 RepID=A0ABT6X0D5_9ACTN|nr:FAD-dependent monooxygenase [Actinoplanes sandaracinus]MDI6105458.1 FAD-dependent monooxygenase [Actinoplanes sandaracinus]
MTVDVDVAVVGAGPVGGLLAGELRLYGVRTVVLEALPEPTGLSKAGTLHARTVQTLELRGLIGDPEPPAMAGPAPFHFAGMFGLDLGPLAAGGPALVGSPQARTEQVFARRATAGGAEIRRGHEMVGLTEEADRVLLRVRGPAGEYVMSARFVVGCDGGRSATRKLAGIDFPGTGATVAALLGEVRLLEPYAAPPGWQRTPRGWTVIMVNPFGISRVFTIDFRAPHPDRTVPVTLDELRRMAEYITGRPMPMTDPRWLTRFGDATRQAATYRRGRVLLAGDAAHVHFPVGGQGLNLGLQDAVNLAWKLAGEVRGWAPPSLLDSYQAERHPQAARVLHNTRAQLALMNPDPAVDPLRDLFADLMRFDPVNRLLGGMISGMDVAYDVGRPDDPLAGRMAPRLRLVDAGGSHTTLARLLHDGTGLLLDLADRPELRAAAADWGGRVRVVAAKADGEPPAEALLVRPDGYVAWSAAADRPAGPDELRIALTTWFGLPR